MREIKFKFVFKNGLFIANKYKTLDELLDSDFALEEMDEEIQNDQNIYDLEDHIEFKLFKCEYSGLKDIRKEEIYEGDLLHSHTFNETFIVKFDEGTFILENLDNTGYHYITDITVDNCTVIGNIFENEELLSWVLIYTKRQILLDQGCKQKIV